MPLRQGTKKIKRTSYGQIGKYVTHALGISGYLGHFLLSENLVKF